MGRPRRRSLPCSGMDFTCIVTLFHLQQHPNPWNTSSVAEASAYWRNEPSQTKHHASDSGEGTSLEEILDACFERSFVHLAVAHDEVPRQFVQRHAGALETQGVEHHL